MQRIVLACDQGVISKEESKTGTIAGFKDKKGLLEPRNVGSFE